MGKTYAYGIHYSSHSQLPQHNTQTHKHTNMQVGGVPLKDILRISLLDDVTFELAAADRRRRVFVAGGQDERDLWVGYISEGIKARAGVDICVCIYIHILCVPMCCVLGWVGWQGGWAVLTSDVGFLAWDAGARMDPIP